MQTITDFSHSGPILVHEEGWVSIGYGLEVLLPPDSENGDKWLIEVGHFKTPTHLGSARISDTIAISSESQLLSLINGNTVYTENATNLTYDYPDKPSQPQVNHRSSIVSTLYNHIFLARGRTLWWTDLDNYWNWQPSPESEADFRTVEWEGNDITGLATMNDVLYMHFPKSIYSVEYIGKPTVVRITKRNDGVGSVSHRSLCVHQSMQFFLGLDNFYAYSIQGGLSPIGNEVWERFVNTCTDFLSVWVYADQLHNEICFVSGNLIWAFNLSGKYWTKYSSNQILDHTTVSWLPAQQLVTPTDTDTLSDLDKVNPIGAENLWVTSECVCRDQRSGDGLEKCLEMERPFLETDDITYGDIHFHKKVDLVLIDGNYDLPWMGVKVMVSGRDYISDRKRWVDCGVWTQELKSKQIDFAAVSGRVLKYRFEVLSDLEIGALLNGGVNLDGKRPDVFDGRMVMSGVKTLLPRQIPVCDGSLLMSDMGVTRLNWFDLAAWGERVDLPTVVTGPDK
jgi:hypothetical protein